MAPLYSEFEDQQVAPPTQSVFLGKTLSFVLTKAFSHWSLCHFSLGPFSWLIKTQYTVYSLFINFDLLLFFKPVIASLNSLPDNFFLRYLLL